MNKADVSPWPDLFIVKDFLAPDICREVVTEMDLAQGEAARVYTRTTSTAVDQGIRQTLRLRPSHEIVELIKTRLLA